jgi:hypothetical protein
MRHGLALALLTLMTSAAALDGRAAIGQGSLHAAKVTTARGAMVFPAPSGFSVQPGISDPACNAGRGIRLPAQLGDDPIVVTGTMADGLTLIAISSGYPAKRAVVLRAVTRSCGIDRAFGEGGVATITISSRPQLAPPAAGSPLPDGLTVDAVAPREGGGVILAGSYGGEWVVGAVTPVGKVDPSFGSGGWTVLPLHGEVRAVLSEPSGRLVIGGDNGGGGCCTVNWAAAVSARGRLEDGFGTQGREELPTGEDSGVEALAREPNGDILAQVGYGNMGCWGVGLAMLMPSGTPVPRFVERLNRFWKGLGFGAFVGGIYLDGEGFTLVGTGQTSCAEGPSSSATGLIARFRADGRPSADTIRFPSKLYGSLQAFAHGKDALVVESAYGDSTELTVTARRPDGSADSRFGNRGQALIRTPWKGRNAALETSVSLTQASPNTFVVVATMSGQHQLQLIRVRL